MQISYQNRTYTLSKKERTVGSEAPAVRAKMLSNETKVIGMMAPKIQVMITLPHIGGFTQALHDILQKYSHKILAYVITSSSLEETQSITREFDFDEACICVDFQEFANKFGVNMENQFIAKSLFIIDKEGEITYIDILENGENSFDVSAFQHALDEIVNQKTKGHTHENWMGA